MWTWTDDRIALLRQWWADGRSAAQIAEAFSAREGAAPSRNGVIGKAHRLGLDGRPSPIRPRTPEPLPASPLSSLTERACRYPHGHPGEPGFYFCARESARPGLPYCAEHMAACYRPSGAPDTGEDVVAGILGKPLPARRHVKRAIFGTVAS